MSTTAYVFVEKYKHVNIFGEKGALSGDMYLYSHIRKYHDVFMSFRLH